MPGSVPAVIFYHRGMPVAREDAARQARKGLPAGSLPRAARVLPAGLLTALLLGTTACAAAPSGPGTAATRPTTSTAALTPTPTARTPPAVTPPPSPAPPPLRTAAPVRSVARSTRDYGRHWAGYVFRADGVTGARARWVQPAVTGRPDDEMFIWVGVGGWNETAENIVQVGTYAYLPKPSGDAGHGVWYEIVPGLPHAVFARTPVSPGDVVEGSVEQTGARGRDWALRLTDLTNGWEFTTTIAFRSLHSSPAFVVEAPNRGRAQVAGPYYRLPRWDRVAFAAAEVKVDGHWMPAASLRSYRIDMRRGGAVLARTGRLSTSSSFTVTAG